MLSSSFDKENLINTSVAVNVEKKRESKAPETVSRKKRKLKVFFNNVNKPIS